MILGTLFCFMGFALFSFSFGFWEFLLAEILLGIGNSFISGSDSAILYDSLLQSQKTNQYTKIEGKTYSIGNFAEAGAGILGGFLAEIFFTISMVRANSSCSNGYSVCNIFGRATGKMKKIEKSLKQLYK